MNDAFFYHHLANELKTLEGGRIDKINMASKDEIYLTIKNGKLFTLVLCANPTFPRAYITNQKVENPTTPFSFLMHLRKRISGAVIEKIEQIPHERVLKFSLSVKDLFAQEKYSLYAEIMGRYSNVILVDGDEKISQCLFRTDAQINSKRLLLPGVKYLLPPTQENKRPITTKAEFVKTVSLFDGKTALHNFLISHYIGFAPFTFKQAILLSEYDKNGDSGKLFDTLSFLYSNCVPCYAKKDGKIVDFYSFACKDCQEIVFTSTLSEAMDEYYRQVLSARAHLPLATKLKTVVKSALSRCEKKLETLLSRIQDCENRENDRICGELITANIYKIKQGDKSVRAYDYYSNLERDIPLDTTLSPAQNAQNYFKKYNKKKRTVQISADMLTKTTEYKDYLDTLLLCVTQAVSQSDLEELEKEMENTGLVSKKTKKAKKTASKPRRYEVDGYTVLIGKNNLQNDELVKNSDGGFLWLHTQKIHGSHTVIQGKNVPLETVCKVASYSAFFSKASLSDNVPVDYTLVKHVKKPSGALPGKVVYTNQQTVFVTPKNPDLVNNI